MSQPISVTTNTTANATTTDTVTNATASDPQSPTDGDRIEHSAAPSVLDTDSDVTFVTAAPSPNDNSTGASSTAAAPQAKAGRNSKFTSDQDVPIMREVAAEQAHLAAYGDQ